MTAHRLVIPLCLLALPFATAQAQTITMNKACRTQVAAAQQGVDGGQFATALAAFDGLVDKCKSRDAKEQIQVGRAAALNGLGRHEDAITAAEAALEVTKDQSLNAHFERAYAAEKLGRVEQARADYDRIIELTAKNRNVKERATVYAKLADMSYRNGDANGAEEYLATAMQLDSANPDFHLQRGDWASAQGNYDQAFKEYDQAASLAGSDPDVYVARTESRLKMVQEKYGTTDSGELRSKMSPAEKEMVCTEMNQALGLGLRNMQFDMFSALVCR